MHAAVHLSTLVPDFLVRIFFDLSVLPSVIFHAGLRILIALTHARLEVDHILVAVDLTNEEHNEEANTDENGRKQIKNLRVEK